MRQRNLLGVLVLMAIFMVTGSAMGVDTLYFQGAESSAIDDAYWHNDDPAGDNLLPGTDSILRLHSQDYGMLFDGTGAGSIAGTMAAASLEVRHWASSSWQMVPSTSVARSVR